MDFHAANQSEAELLSSVNLYLWPSQTLHCSFYMFAALPKVWIFNSQKKEFSHQLAHPTYLLELGTDSGKLVNAITFTS